MKRAAKWGSLILLAIVIAVLVAPFIRVDQYKEQIRLGLERTLHRKVEIYGDTRLSLFRGPGFSVEKVVIYDDPSAGIEPFADVPELQASVRLSSLWTRRLDIATVRLVEPRINIVKPDRASWNVVPLLAGAAQSGGRVPEIQVSQGRFNLKFGDVKSPFYLTEADVTVSPRREGFDLRFSLAPARTDRSASGYGEFSGRGRIENGRVDLDVQLERTSIAELVTLVRGQSLGMHGSMSSRAKVSGPLSRVAITGQFDLEDVHRWDLITSRTGRVKMNYRGSFDLGAQRLELVADSATNPDIPGSIRMYVTELLYRPVWTGEVALNGMPAAALIDAARHVGAPIPGGITIEGNAAGVVGYSSANGIQGQITIRGAAVQIDKGPRLDLPQASVSLTGDELRLLPATLSIKGGGAAQLEAIYAPFRQQLTARLTGRDLDVEHLQDGPGHLLNGARVPVVDRFRGGSWTGAIAYASVEGEPPQWQAQLDVKNTSTQLPGMAEPVRFASATVLLEGDRLEVRRMRALAANAEVYGSYLYDPESERPHRFALTIPSLDLAQLEAHFQPTLSRGGSFLARTLRLRQGRLPEWLRGRRAEGTVRVGTLTAGDLHFRALRSRVVWNGATVQMPNLECRFDEAAIRATAVADLSRRDPAYKLRGSMKNYGWHGGHAELEGSLTASGSGVDLLASLHAEGKYDLRSVTMAPEFLLQTAAGTFDVAASRSGPQVKLTVSQASSGAERFTGEGSTEPDGRLHLDLASGTRVMRLAGPVLPLKLEVLHDRGAAR